MIVFSNKNLQVDTYHNVIVQHKDILKIFQHCKNPVKTLEVYIRLINIFDMDTNGCLISINNMSENWKISRDTVIKYIKELEKLKLILSEISDGGTKFYSKYVDLNSVGN